ncbi:MAG: Dienelactone hydrolase family protein [Frankiales bacterium]|nr:Dienelactone hydrolase family protein [Frankiales bacterium]
MASIVLLHSALGRRPSDLADAARWRAHGHEVLVPDYYDGAVFDDVEEGVAHKDAVGSDVLTARVAAAVDGLPPGQVWAGWSLGGALAQEALERHGGRAALFLGYEGWTSPTWPGVPVQVHAAADDPWVDEEALAAFAAASGAEVFRYEGGHLFADPGTTGHSPASAALLQQRVDAFLAGL